MWICRDSVRGMPDDVAVRVADEGLDWAAIASVDTSFGVPDSVIREMPEGSDWAIAYWGFVPPVALVRARVDSVPAVKVLSF